MTTSPEPHFPDLLALDVHRVREFTPDRVVRRGISWSRSGRITHLVEGDGPSQRRGPLIDAFGSDPGAFVLFSSDAGCAGLNVQPASVLIRFDCPWNSAVLEQCSAAVEDKRFLLEATVLHDADTDALALGGEQLDRMLGTLSAHAEQLAAGKWQHSAISGSGDALTSTDAPGEPGPTPTGTSASIADLPDTPQDAINPPRGVRLPACDDTWRCIHAEGLPAVLVSSAHANARPVVRMGEEAVQDRIAVAWTMVA
ncbi:MAG: hypothetical protein EA398_10945 [Deltaproteobacteria bacterium]|nr:MAG: hypothetical protein EA398_10945 [Deltaproteobacteria bacterium]